VQSVILLGLGAVDTLLEDGLGLIELKLGLEVMKMIRVAAAVGAATSVGELELLVDDLLTGTSPVTLAATVLLGLLGINTIEAVLGKELGNILLRKNSTLGDAGVVFVVELVRSSHDEDLMVVDMMKWRFVMESLVLREYG
jgi:hypothetical protein